MAESRRLSRRSLLAAGAGLAAAYAVGCGDDNSAEVTPSATATIAPATVSPTATAANPTPVRISARWGRLPSVDPQPAGRRDHSLVAAGSTLYVFGGRDPNPIGDLWQHDLTTSVWTEITAAGPAPRFGHNAAVDAASNRMIVFGGQGSGFFNDTWQLAFGDSAWTQVDGGSGPLARYGSASAYDPAGRLVISHGFTSAGRFDDTWALTLAENSWLDSSPGAGRPLARCLTRGAWDQANSRLLMFGGQSNPTPFLGDFWALGPSGWAELPGGPVARNLYAMVFDPTARRLILVGGAAETGNLNDVWVYDVTSNEWEQVSPEGEAPSARASHDAVWVPSRNALVLFGGFDGAYLNDFWQLEFL